MTEILIGEKEKRTKGNGKQEEADYLTQYKSYPTFVPNFKIVGAVIAQKSLTKKKTTHTNKHCYGKDKNYIPPIYFVYQGYKYSSPPLRLGEHNYCY